MINWIETLRSGKTPIGFERVDSDTFFDTMDPLNVHPSSVGKYDEDWGYVSEWRMLDAGRSLIGLSAGGTHLKDNVYFLGVGGDS